MGDVVQQIRELPSVTIGHLRFTADGPVAVLTFNRPEARNALTFQMYRDVGAICRMIGEAGAFRALILMAEGERAFASGTDMKEFRSFSKPEDAIAYEREVGGVLDRIEACPVPTIAVLSGACTGGGLGIAACCDIRIAQANLQLGLPMARTLGNCLAVVNLARFSALMGQARLAELMMTARLMPAAEALSIGAVSEVLLGREALCVRAMELAAAIASHAPITLQVTKEGLRRLRASSREIDSSDLILRAYGSRDFQEGLSAFLDKRKPRWTGE
ncbi:enoyl-CoA hydratase [Pseudochelatococcus sp. B33]